MTACWLKTIIPFGLLLLAGCGSADEKIPVRGTVFCDQKPMGGASVAFIGKEGGAFSSAVTDAKGEFMLRAAPGKNKVSVSKENPQAAPPFDPNADQSMPTETEYAAMVKKLPKPLVAEKFSDPEKSGIVIDVSSGMSSVDINVSSK
jgi:hypothetical protein